MGDAKRRRQRGIEQGIPADIADLIAELPPHQQEALRQLGQILRQWPVGRRIGVAAYIGIQEVDADGMLRWFASDTVAAWRQLAREASQTRNPEGEC